MASSSSSDGISAGIVWFSSSEQLDAPDSPSLRMSASARLHAMRTDPEGTCADVELCAEGYVIRAHRSVLTTYEHFRNLLGTGSAFSEAATGRVDFEDVSSEGLQIVVDYIYDYPLDPDAEFLVLDEVWSFATVHVMDDLVASVRDRLMAVVTPDRVLHLLRRAVQLQDSKCMAASAKLVVGWIGAHDFVSNINDCGYDELVVLKRWCLPEKMPQWSRLVVAWMVQDPADRHLNAERLLESVDFASMSSEHLSVLNQEVGRQPDEPALRVERKLRDALLGRMDRILDRREAMLKSFDQKSFGMCSEDLCAPPKCIFVHKPIIDYPSKSVCSKCRRVRCEGAFAASGKCASCGHLKRSVTSVPCEHVKDFASSLSKP